MADSCDPLTGVAHTPIDPDDGVSCTVDSCDPIAGVSNTPNDGLCGDGQFCNGVEICDPVLDCQAGADPCLGAACDEAGDVCEGVVPAPRMETGVVTVGGTHVTVPLTNIYASPVVVASVEYTNNTTPVVARVGNVTAQSFDIRLQNPSDGPVVAETVSYVVVEEGVWTIDGVNVEAHAYLSTVTDKNNSWSGEPQTYGQSYSNPVVLGQVMTENDPDWSVFWCSGSLPADPPSSGVLRTGKMVGEDPDVARADETVGFIVFEAGTGTIGGVQFEAALGADLVRGVTNKPPYVYPLSGGFSSAPLVAVATQAAMDGAHASWAITFGPGPLTTTSIGLAVDEDQLKDPERNHSAEQVGYVVFETPVSFE